MRIALLTDIHEDVDRLAEALDLCDKAKVDRVVTLGDIFQDGARFDETVRLLREAGVGGVWGNHEFGICHDPGDWLERDFDATVRDYMGRLAPRLEIEGVLLGHVLPRHDPTDVTQPWYVERPPETAEAAAFDFAAFPHRRMFVGHYHRWYVVSTDGPEPWSATSPFAFDADRRYLVVVAAVCDGWCAIYDTESDVLTPQRLRHR